MNRLFTVIFFLLLLPSLALASTVGKIKGNVTDLTTGEPLIGANVLVVSTSFGAATDVNGEYLISNLEAGVYEVRASYIGYQTITVSNVRVNADLTTELNFQLPLEGIEVGEVEVIAERPLVNKSSTNANRITTSDQIDALPIRGVNNILAITPGVNVQDKTVYVRGGRQDEVGYYLEGANITNPLVGGRKVTISQDAVEYITDNITFKSRNERFDGKERLGARWYGYSEIIGTISGPIIDNRFKLFGLVNYTYQADR